MKPFPAILIRGAAIFGNAFAIAAPRAAVHWVTKARAKHLAPLTRGAIRVIATTFDRVWDAAADETVIAREAAPFSVRYALHCAENGFAMVTFWTVRVAIAGPRLWYWHALGYALAAGG